MFEMESAAAELESVIGGIGDDQLALPTPAGITVRELLVHVVGLTEAFRQAATKESVGASVAPEFGADTPLIVDWRTRIPLQAKALAAAWREPGAWAGATEAGGVTMPAAEMALVALDEVIVHGWDLARATGQSYDPAAVDLAVLLEFLPAFPAEGVPGMFGPRVEIPADAPALHRVLGLTGRDPHWTA